MSKQFDMRKVYHADPTNLWFFRIMVLIAFAGIYVCLGIVGVVLWSLPEQISVMISEQMTTFLQQ